VTVHKDSKITLQSLKNTKNPNYLIEVIRNTAIALEKRNWTITFAWIKAHAGIYGNELADKLAKEASRKEEISFNRIPKNEIAQQLRDQSIAMRQNQWDHITKGQVMKKLFPIIKERLTYKIKLTPNIMAIVKAHGKTKAYLHRFKIIVSRMPMRRRDPNSGTPNIRLHQTTERERGIHKQHIQTRQVTSE
jgi:hypothetical protein